MLIYRLLLISSKPDKFFWVDLDGNKLLDEEEIEALFQKEVRNKMTKHLNT